MDRKIIDYIYILSAILFSGIAYAMDAAKPVSLEERNKIFEQFYLNKPGNNDRAIFEHLKVWHENDATVIRATLQQEHSRKNLAKVQLALYESFETQSVTFTRIASAYLVYSLLMTNELAPGREGPQCKIDEACTHIERYARTGQYNKLRYHYDDFEGKDLEEIASLNKLNQEKIWPAYLELERLQRIEKLTALRWLPYVSKDGLASYRILNNICGMRGALLGVPTGWCSYDGEYPTTPFEYAAHEIFHGSWNNSHPPQDPRVYFYYYGQSNLVICRIADVLKQFLCDYFLYQMGHETSFRDVYDALRAVGQSSDIMIHLMHSYDNRLQSLRDSLAALTRSVTFEQFWQDQENIVIHYEGEDGPSQLFDEKHKETSILRKFVKDDKGTMYSLIEIVNVFNLDKSKLLTDTDVIKCFTLPSSVIEGSREQLEISNWLRYLHLAFYNEMIGLQAVFTEIGLNIAIWKGNLFMSQDIEGFFKLSCDAFKKEVAPTLTNPSANLSVE